MPMPREQPNLTTMLLHFSSPLHTAGWRSAPAPRFCYMPNLWRISAALQLLRAMRDQSAYSSSFRSLR